MPEFKGVVSRDITARVGPKVIDNKAPDGKLVKGQTVTVTGFAIDPEGEEFKQRYRILLNGKTLWTSANAVTLPPGQAALLEFIALNPARAAEELLEAMGMDIKDFAQIAMDEARRVAAQLRDFSLAGTFDAAGVAEVGKTLDLLAACGVTLGGESAGRWSISDLRQVRDAVQGMARGTGRLFAEVFGVQDDALAMRVLFAPLHIVRSGKINVNPNPSSGTWFARNSGGYLLVLGSKVFFQGTSVTKKYPALPFTSVELIAHEIAHAINFRYTFVNAAGKRVEPDDHYEPLQATTHKLASGESVKLALNDGYGFVSRSSDLVQETITDGITAYLLGRLTDGDADAKKALAGRARYEMMHDMLRRILITRVRDYAGLADIKSKIANRGGQTMLQQMDAALDLLEGTFDEQMKALKAKLPA